MSAIFLTFGVVSLLGLVRVHVAHAARMKRIEEIYHVNLADIDSGRYSSAVSERRYAEVNPGWRQELDLTKWTYRQFYPEAPK